MEVGEIQASNGFELNESSLQEQSQTDEQKKMKALIGSHFKQALNKLKKNAAPLNANLDSGGVTAGGTSVLNSTTVSFSREDQYERLNRLE